MKILLPFLFLTLAVGAEDSLLPKVKHMIDTHIHLYDTTREKGVPWPPQDDTVL
jgi:hypothetical protein